MNFGEFVILLVLLAALFFIPIIVIQFFGRRGPIFRKNLESSPLEELDAALLQRVRQADDSKKQRRTIPETSSISAEKPLSSQQTKFRTD
jgi:hypothetical protein